MLGCASKDQPVTPVDASDVVVEPDVIGNDMKDNNGDTQMEQEQPTTVTNDDQVTAVTTSREPGSYTFSVTIKSAETGCDQYANWWEVTSADGTELLYRRILGHSHVDEQQFTRSGGPDPIDAQREVVVRMKMNTTGYSPIGFRGSVATGFERSEADAGFGEALRTQDPLPTGCAF